MPLSILVKNQPPPLSKTASKPLLRLLRAYAVDDASPFDHQAEAFRLIDRDKEVFLLARTAAGKTLAVAVLLTEKLRTMRIRKNC
ncbi:MAG: hypothetical protein ABIN58_02010 [candidate division WOR-3 bacterium]